MMITKQKTVLKQEIDDDETKSLILGHLLSGKPIFYLGFYLAEIDKIMEERLPRDHINRQRQKILPNISLDENDNMMVDDWTSRLPEDVLRLILSFMTMREVANTSILSTKWRYLWRTSSNLEFDDLNMTGHEPNNSINKDRFVSWVNRILELHCGKRIDSFMIKCPLGRDYGCDIDRWIQFAVEKRVEKLNVDMFELPLFLKISESKTYKFPYWLFAQEGSRSNLQHLSLNACTFTLPPNFSSFNSLISLTLEYSYLNDDTVENIFACCISLKWFSMKFCSCPVRIKVAGARGFLKLMHLAIDHCKVEEIEVHDAVNLASFEYEGYFLRRIMFKNSAQPVRLCLNFTCNSSAAAKYAFGGFAADFPQVETLLLYPYDWMVDALPMQLPTFTKLKVLVLTLPSSTSLHEMISLYLGAAPFLVKLELCFPLFPSSRKSGVHRMTQGFCRNPHLKEVELHGFHGYRYEFDLAIYLLNHIVVLDKMTIVCKTRDYWGNGGWLIPPCKHKVKPKLVRNKLRGKVPSTARLIVV